jgi:hypothetical protein
LGSALVIEAKIIGHKKREKCHLFR